MSSQATPPLGSSCSARASSASAAASSSAASAEVVSSPPPSAFQDTQCSTGAQLRASRSTRYPGSALRLSQGSRRSKRGCRPARSRITGSITRVTSSRIAGTERKFSTSGITSPQPCRTRSRKPS